MAAGHGDLHGPLLGLRVVEDLQRVVKAGGVVHPLGLGPIDA